MSNPDMMREKPAQRRHRWLHRLLLCFALLAMLVALAGLFFRWHANSTQPWMAVSAFSFYLLIGAPIALVLLLLLRHWLAAIVAVALTVACGWVAVPRFVSDSTTAHGRALVAMTANLRLGEGNPATVVSFVRSRHVSLLMLEELTPAERDRMRAAGLDALLPYNVVDARSDAAGTGLWSAFPLTDEVKHTDFEFALVTARLVLDPAQPQTGPMVAAGHMCGPWPSTSYWDHDIATLPTLLRQLHTQSSTVIMGGDFNSTLDTAQFRRLLQDGYHDAGEQAGAGLLPTYPADVSIPPLIGIDHVLLAGAHADSAVSLHIPGSDHRAVAVTLHLSG